MRLWWKKTEIEILRAGAAGGPLLVKFVGYVAWWKCGDIKVDNGIVEWRLWVAIYNTYHIDFDFLNLEAKDYGPNETEN